MKNEVHHGDAEDMAKTHTHLSLSLRVLRVSVVNLAL
jgi:hypothetical protein